MGELSGGVIFLAFLLGMFVVGALRGLAGEEPHFDPHL